jgi:hypothetical protein
MQCLPAFLNCIGKEVAENSAARSRIINRQHRHSKAKEAMEA